MDSGAENSEKRLAGARPAAIFADHSGRRARRVGGASLVFLLAAIIIASGFTLSLVTRPTLALTFSEGRQHLASYMHRRGPGEKALLDQIAKERRASAGVNLLPTSRIDVDPVLWVIAAIYLAFLGLEVLAGWLAYRADGADKREPWLLPTQRLVYRQIMYIVVWRALGRALTGLNHAWGKLHRTGQARMTLQG